MNLIILGPQGSGKGTQAELLAQKYNLDHFDTGNALRRVASLDTPLGREVKEIIIVKKELVPSRILKEVLHARLSSLGREQGVVFVGLPRNIEQAEYFQDALLEFGRKIDKVFFINISEQESIERISRRRSCVKCREAYILGKNLEKDGRPCAKCGGEVVQRKDDTPEGIRKRLKVYREETMPVIEYFKNKDLLAEINGEQGSEKVFAEIIKHLS